MPFDLLEQWNGPAVLLVDLDAFFASVEQLDHPAWAGKPVIVGGDADKHGVVSTASYEARKYGVHSAMPSSTAKKLCPQAIWASGHFDRYREVSRQVINIIADESPYVEQVSIDEAFVDVSPTRINCEHPAHVAARIQQRVSRLGITCSIGVGSSKTIAKVASDQDKPNGLTIVFPGSEADFLAPLPISRMSGVGRKAQESLHRYGIKTLGDLAGASPALLKSIFGKNAEMMRNRCLGIDETPVEQDMTVKSVSNETTFSTDLETLHEIENAVDVMAAKVARRLRKKGLKSAGVSLKLKFSDQSTRSAQTQLRHASDNEHEFIPVLHSLIPGIWQPGMHVRLVGVATTKFNDSQPI